jgi:23S rRNA (cytidine1920-2'-O)/16S rRNA (cytidine1409-2'-O)-methyltransferase
MRLDKALVMQGICRSRTEAQTLLDAELISVNGRRGLKASAETPEGAVLARHDTGPRFVSRGALKLEGAMTEFGVDAAGKTALDVGASTGGFTECLLRRGAQSVIAIDVGHGQMAPEIAADPRVQSREGVNARSLAPSDFPHPFDLIVADLSFISLTLILPALVPLLTPAGDLICLVKPQFEVGAAHLGKGGIVRDAKARAEALERVTGAAQALGLREAGRMISPIEGSDGNTEFLLHLRLGERKVIRE